MPDDKALASPPPDPNPPWGSAPTLANVELEPRLRLRDGSHSSASTRSSTRAASRSRGRAGQRRGSTRSEGVESVVSTESFDMPATTTNTTSAAAARSTHRLPRLLSRRSRPTIEQQDDVLTSDDEPLALSRSRSPRKRSASRMAEGAESSSSTSSEGGGSARRRFTAAEKGKGRAAPPSPTPIEIASDSDDSPILADESVQFIKHQPASPVPVEDEVESVIGDDDAITAYNCPVCFSAPTAPALTPCGHVLCYSCLHATLVAAIGRNQNPYIMAQPPRGRGRGRARGRGARGGRGGRQPQPTEWDVDSLREAVTTQADAMLRDQIQANGTVGDTAELIFNVQREERGDAQIEHPLKGLWQVQGSWVIEGECPVCRDPIEGGLGPIGSGIGGVILLETKVRHAGDLV